MKQAAADQRLVGIAFEEGDEHFHTHAWSGDASVGISGPASGDAQPAAGVVVGLAVTIPMELDFDTPVFVAMDFFTRWPGDEGRLDTQRFGFGVLQGRAVMRIPRRGQEVITVALVKIVFVIRDVAGDVFAQHLRLFAFVNDFQQQPEVVPLCARMFVQGQEMAADQRRLVAFAFGELVVAAMAFQGASRQLFAALTAGEAARVVVVLQVRSKGAFGGAFGQDAWLFEVVIAPADAGGAGFQAQVETFDHRLFSGHAGVLLVTHWRQFAEHRLIIAEHQCVTAGIVLEVEVNAFFFTQALDEMQV